MQLPVTVAIDFMNKDHAEFVEQLTQLNTALKNDSNKIISELLTKLVEHTCEHFSHEECEMQRISFPPYPMHKGEHDQVIDSLKSAVIDWDNRHDREALEKYISDTVTPWFYLHVDTMDSITAQFIQRFDSMT
ncbi:MAG: hemerythrin family protein [Gammaproteobacteria bacterium]|nr:hemerythrin family protein [Gammaproteobacteria bacterium]